LKLQEQLKMKDKELEEFKKEKYEEIELLNNKI
jgi:hypothetical protein